MNFGYWEPEAGHLVARQLEKDGHLAASRWQVASQDSVIEFRFRFAGAKQFHLGFDPAPGELKKKGHLFSLIITPTTATIKKHHDKADKKSKEAILATASVKLQKDEWIAVRMQTIGNQVSVQVGKNIKLEASDDSFHVKKPTVVFRVGGGDIHIDDLVLIKK